MRQTGSRDQFGQRVQGVALIVCHPLGLVRHHDGALAQGVLGGHAGRAFAGVAGLRLNAADREHESARRIAPVGAKRQNPRHVEGRGDLAAGTDPDPVADPDSDQCVVDKAKAVAQWHADMVHKFQRCGPGAAFLAVDNDEVRGDAGGDHCLANGHELPRVADAKLEPRRFSAGKFAHADHEFQKARRGGKDRMAGR